MSCTVSEALVEFAAMAERFIVTPAFADFLGWKASRGRWLKCPHHSLCRRSRDVDNSQKFSATNFVSFYSFFLNRKAGVPKTLFHLLFQEIFKIDEIVFSII